MWNKISLFAADTTHAFADKQWRGRQGGCLAIAVLPTYLSLMKGIIRHACSMAWGIWDKDASGQQCVRVYEEGGLWCEGQSRDGC